ncbi:MAG: PAS domain S-box protein, partial [Pseudomonadota bacterium]|nr:PAS domain S-box protein [Pseudomonadota bacterium]
APVSFLGKNYGFRVYFRQALAQGESAYVAKGVTSRIPGYYLSHAVRLQGKVLGVVVSKISMDMIEARLGWHNGHNGHLLTSAIIADPRGVVLMPQNQRFQTLLPLSPAERQAIAGEKQYEGEALPPLALTRLGQVKGMTRVRFAAAPDRTLFEKAYPMPGMGQLYLYEDPARYMATLWLHAALGFAAGLVAVLLAYLAMQRRSSREALRLAIEGSGDAVWDWDIPSDELRYSHSFAAMLGYGDNELGHVRAALLRRLVDPRDAGKAEAELEACLHGRVEQCIAEQRFRCRDGSWKWILSRGKVTLRDDQGRPLRMSGTHGDITGRKQAEEALQESKNLLSAITGAARDAIILIDDAGNILFWNAAAEKLFGYPAGEIMGRNMHQIVVPERFLGAHETGFA